MDAVGSCLRSTPWLWRAGRHGTPAASLLPAGLAIAAVLVVASPEAPADASGGSSSPPLAVAGSSIYGASTWAAVPMGIPGRPLDTFWQEVVLPSASASWRLATPRGVASNGGFAVSLLGERTAVVAVMATNLLAFSPVTTTVDAGRAWAAVGALPGAVAPLPSALDASAPGGPVVALLGAARRRVVVGHRSGGGIASWSTIASAETVASATSAQGCRVTALDAVALAPPGEVAVGASCDGSGVVGIITRAGGGHWRATGPRLAGAYGDSSTEVLRMDASAAGVTVVVKARTARATALFSCALAGGELAAPHPSWQVSAPRTITGQDVEAVSVGGGGSVAVLLRARGGPSTAVVDRGGHWSNLPRVPPGTAAVTIGPDGRTDALAVSRSRLTDYLLGARGSSGGSWGPRQALTVPIAYGSSG